MICAAFTVPQLAGPDIGADVADEQNAVTKAAQQPLAVAGVV